jgi:hypothetical protein
MSAPFTNFREVTACDNTGGQFQIAIEDVPLRRTRSKKTPSPEEAQRRKNRLIELHRRYQQLRSEHGKCPRCGQPWSGSTIICESCLKRERLSRKLRKSESGVVLKLVRELQATMNLELGRFRRELDHLQKHLKKIQASSKGAWKRGHSKGYSAGRKHGIDIARYANAYPTISPQELSTMSHLYDNPEREP